MLLCCLLSCSRSVLWSVLLVPHLTMQFFSCCLALCASIRECWHFLNLLVENPGFIQIKTGGGRCWGMWLLIERLPGSTTPWFQSTAPYHKLPLAVYTYNLNTQEVEAGPERRSRLLYLYKLEACLQNTAFEENLASCPVSTSVH